MNKTDRNGLIALIVILLLIALIIFANRLYRKYREKILFINLQNPSVIPLGPQQYMPIGPTPSTPTN